MIPLKWKSCHIIHHHMSDLSKAVIHRMKSKFTHRINGGCGTWSTQWPHSCLSLQLYFLSPTSSHHSHTASHVFSCWSLCQYTLTPFARIGNSYLFFKIQVQDYFLWEPCSEYASLPPKLTHHHNKHTGEICYTEQKKKKIGKLMTQWQIIYKYKASKKGN